MQKFEHATEKKIKKIEEFRLNQESWTTKEIIGGNRSHSRNSESLLKVKGSNEQEYCTTIDSIMIKTDTNTKKFRESNNWLKPELAALKLLVSEEFYTTKKNYPSASCT